MCVMGGVVVEALQYGLGHACRDYVRIAEATSSDCEEHL